MPIAKWDGHKRHQRALQKKKSTFKAKISKDINVYIRCIITHLSKLCFEVWICHRGLQILQILTGTSFSPGTVSACSLSTAI